MGGFGSPRPEKPWGEKLAKPCRLFSKTERYDFLQDVRTVIVKVVYVNTKFSQKA